MKTRPSAKQPARRPSAARPAATTTTVGACPVTVAGRVITVAPAGASAPVAVSYDIAGIKRVQLVGLSDGLPVVKVLLYILFGAGMIATAVSALCAIEPQYNQSIEAAYHLDMASLLPFAAVFALMMFGAIGLNDRFKVVVITLNSGETRELFWATSKATLADAVRLKDAIAQAHVKYAEGDVDAV